MNNREPECSCIPYTRVRLNPASSKDVFCCTAKCLFHVWLTAGSEVVLRCVSRTSYYCWIFLKPCYPDNMFHALVTSGTYMLVVRAIEYARAVLRPAWISIVLKALTDYSNSSATRDVRIVRMDWFWNVGKKLQGWFQHQLWKPQSFSYNTAQYFRIKCENALHLLNLHLFMDYPRITQVRPPSSAHYASLTAGSLLVRIFDSFTSSFLVAAFLHNTLMNSEIGLFADW